MFKGNSYFIAEIRDKEFVDELISVLLNSSDREIDENIKHVLKRMLDDGYIDIALPNTDYDCIMQKGILEHIIISVLQNKPISVIRDELLSNATLNERVEYILNEYKTKKKISFYIKPLINKIKLLSLYKFLIKIGGRVGGITNDIKQNSDFDSSVSDIVEDINILYKEINFDKMSTEVNISSMNVDEIKSFLNTYIDISKNNNVIRSGIRLLDNLFNLGGFHKGNIYMFSAPYGTGKTRFLTILGGNIFLQGYNVLHITIENEKEEVLRLYNNFILEMDDNEIGEFIKANGIDFVANEIKSRFDKIKTKYGNNLELKKLPYKSIPKDIENVIISKDDFKPDVIIIDHVDLLYSNKQDIDLFKRMEDVMSELKDICEKYRVCMIIASQLNREGSKGRKDLNFVIGDTVSRSIAKNELTSFHAILMQTFEESVNNYIRIFIDKNRFGVQNVMFPLYFDKGRLYIEEVLTNEDFENYIKSVEGLLQNKTTQRVINAMKMFINSIKVKIEGDLYSYKNNINNTFKEISEIINESDNIDNPKTETNINNIEEINNFSKNNDLQENNIKVNNNNESKLDNEDLEVLNDFVDLDIVYNNKEYKYDEFIKEIEKSINIESKDLNDTNNNFINKVELQNQNQNKTLYSSDKNITGLVRLINEKFFDNINDSLTDENDNKDYINNEKNENDEEIKIGYVIESNKHIEDNQTSDSLNDINSINHKHKNYENNITFIEYIDKYVKHTNFQKIYDNYELISENDNLIIKLKKDTYYNIISIDKSVIENLEKEYTSYFSYTKMSEDKITKEELFLMHLLLNGISYNNIPNESYGNIYTIIKNFNYDNLFLEVKPIFINNDNQMYELYKDTIIEEVNTITNELINEVNSVIENNIMHVYIPKGSSIIITNTNNIYIITEEVEDIIKKGIFDIYEKYKNMSISELYKYYRSNVKLIDNIRESFNEYSLISMNDKLTKLFIHSIISMVYS